MAPSVAVETPLQDEVRRLVAALNDYLLPLSPIEFQFKMTVEQMAGPDTTVFVAREAGGAAVGIGALRLHEGGVGEVKRMFTRPELRGRRIGEAILGAIEARAGASGVSRLVLETGAVAGFEPARRLYERSGFTRCGVVLDYPDSQWSAFYEKRLSTEAAA